MRKFLWYFLLVGYIFFVPAYNLVFAATGDPVFIEDPTEYGLQSCNVCGACWNRSQNAVEAPGDYASCKTCLGQNKEGIAPEYRWTPLGCLPTSPDGFTQVILRVFISIVGGFAFLAILYGGALILFSGGIPERVETGRSILISSIAGVLLVIFAVFILEFIGLEIFGLPGFGGS